MRTAKRQQGLTLISMLLLAAMAGVIILIVLRLTPIMIDYFTVVSVAESIQSAKLEDRSSRAKVRDLVQARFRTNNIYKLSPDVIKIEYDKQRNLVLHVKYEDRRPVIANFDVVAKFDRRVDSGN